MSTNTRQILAYHESVETESAWVDLAVCGVSGKARVDFINVGDPTPSELCFVATVFGLEMPTDPFEDPLDALL